MPKKLYFHEKYTKIFHKRYHYEHFVNFTFNGLTNYNNKVNCIECTTNEKHKLELIRLICNNSNCNLIDMCEVQY